LLSCGLRSVSTALAPAYRHRRFHRAPLLTRRHRSTGREPATRQGLRTEICKKIVVIGSMVVCCATLDTFSYLWIDLDGWADHTVEHPGTARNSGHGGRVP
jgi:hypothetical protein